MPWKRGYIEPDHPVQKRVRGVLEEMTGLDLSRAPRGTDGCGIPVIGISLRGMARAMARLADAKGLASDVPYVVVAKVAGTVQPDIKRKHSDGREDKYIFVRHVEATENIVIMGPSEHN